MADWTEEEARAYLPRLRGLLGVIRRASELAGRVRTNGHGSIGAPAASQEDAGDAEPDPPLTGITAEEALSEIEERGIVLRDLARGLVDFPSRHPNGRPVLLCWLSDEDDLGWWHLPEDGFAGRRPLPLPPEL